MNEEDLVTGQKFLSEYDYNDDHQYFVQVFYLLSDKEQSKFSTIDPEVGAIRWYPVEEVMEDIEKHPDSYIKNMKGLLEYREYLS